MKLTLPDVPKSEQTPLVTELLGIIAQLIEQVQFQKEQISKGYKSGFHFIISHQCMERASTLNMIFLSNR